MVVLNWLILLAVSEKLSHSFPVSKVILSDPLLGDDNKNITGEGTYTAFSIYEETYTH